MPALVPHFGLGAAAGLPGEHLGPAADWAAHVAGPLLDALQRAGPAGLPLSSPLARHRTSYTSGSLSADRQ